MGRIGLVQVDDDAPATDLPLARSPEREALAAAIERHAQVQTALEENAAAQRRADEAVYAARSALDAATEAVATAKTADAMAIAQGRPGGATKLARAQLQDAEDAYEAAKTAQTMLAKERAANLDNDIALARLNRALAAVVREDPSTRKLIANFQAAQQRLFDLREAISEIARLHNALPDEAKFWDASDWLDNLRSESVSETAARVREWIARLKSDAGATFCD